MKSKAETKVETELLHKFRSLPQLAKQETLDFVAFLAWRAETSEEATAELTADTQVLSTIRKGISDYKAGEIKKVVF